MTSAEHLANLREDNATLRAGLSTLLPGNRLLTAVLRVSLETIVDNVFGVGFFFRGANVGSTYTRHAGLDPASGVKYDIKALW